MHFYAMQRFTMQKGMQMQGQSPDDIKAKSRNIENAYKDKAEDWVNNVLPAHSQYKGHTFKWYSPEKKNYEHHKAEVTVYMFILIARNRV